MELTRCLARFTIHLIAVGEPPLTVMLWNVAVVRGVPDRTVDELSNEISVPGVAERFCDDVNEHVVEGDGLISPPRHGSRGVKFQRLDCCIRGFTSLAIVANDVLPRFVGLSEEVGVVRNSIFEPEIWLSHRSSKDRSEIAEFDVRQVLDDAEEVSAAPNERTADVVLRKAVHLPDDDVTCGLQIAKHYFLHGVRRYVNSAEISERLGTP